MVARICAETGVKSLFLHLHELAQKFQNQKSIVQLRGEWVPVNPSEWRTRRNVTVSIGLGLASREQKLLHLEAVWGKQMALLEKGGANGVVTAENVYNTAVEIAKNGGLTGPSKYFTRAQMLGVPTSEQEALQRQQQQLQAREQQLDAQRQANERAKIELRAREQMFEMRTKIAKLELEAKDQRDKSEQAMRDDRIELEKLRNQLTELELKYGQDVPGAKV